MGSNVYSINPVACHAKTFFLNPAPFLTPLTRHVPAPALALDVGCGSGRALLWLKQRGHNALDLERTQGLVKLARRHARREALCKGFDETEERFRSLLQSIPHSTRAGEKSASYVRGAYPWH
jgi:SAM-dependent methyltransferase